MAEEKLALSININSGDAEKTVGELKQEFKELQEQIQKTTVGSDEYLKAMARLGEVKGDLKDLKEDMAALNPENKVQPWLNLTSGIANGFAAAQGAMALFGGESEAVQQSILKVQAAMAIGSGIQNIVQLGDTFRVLKAQIMASEVAQKALNFAMNANPIGLLIAGITALAGALMFWKSSTDESTEAVKKSNDALKENTKELYANSQALDDNEKHRQRSSKVINDLVNLNIALKKELADLDSQYKVLTKTETQFNADREKALSDYQQNVKAAEKAFRNGRTQVLKETYEEDLRLLREKYDRQLEIIREKELEARREASKSLEDVQSKGLEAIKVEQHKTGEIKKVNEILLSDLQAGRQAADEKYILDTQEKYELLMGLMDGFAQGSAALNELLGKQGDELNDIQKAVALVHIGIETSKAVASVISKAQAVGLPFSIAYAAIGIGNVLSGMAQAKRILEGSTKGSRPSISASFSAGSGGGGVFTQPQGLKQVNQNTTNLQDFKDTSGERKQAPIIKTYVVESEITDSQKRIASIQRKAKF